MPVPDLVHRGIAYTDSAALGAALAPPVGEALADGRSVVVALEDATTGPLRDALGPDAEAIRFLDVTRPARTDAFQLAARIATFAAHSARAGTASMLITQHQPTLGRSDAYWLRLEAAVDAALQGLPATLWCLYRTGAPAYSQCHSEVGPMTGPHPNTAYRTPTDVVRGLPSPAPAPAPVDARSWHFDAAGLGNLRRELAVVVGESGLDDDAGEDLVYACSEVATNAVEHGGGNGTVWAWTADDEVVCQVAGAGRITDPFPGVVPPPVDQDRGRGLWLARALCDEVDVASDADGTTVRLARRLVRAEPTTRQTR
jgi:anti-sigma regulatory factor (Ser/Thr protein kinase)